MKISNFIILSIAFLYKYSICSPFMDFMNKNFESFQISNKFESINEHEEQESIPEEDNDLSIFGNTHESFVEFAERRVAELKNINKNLFEKAVDSCPYSVKPEEINEEIHAKRFSRSLLNMEKKRCTVGSFSFENNNGLTSDRIFLFDAFTIGVISGSDSSLRMYNFNMYQKTLNHIRTKYFRNEVPADACADKNKNIFVVFPDQNKIAKLYLNQPVTSKYSNKQNKTQSILKEVASNRDSDFRPSTVACYDDHIYVSENPKNQIRIYDKNLRLIRILYLNGIVVSNHRGLAIDHNVRVLMDGSDSLAIFNPSLSTPISNNKKYTLMTEKNRVSVCHFYKNMDCIEDVHVATESKTKSFIFTADSCNNEIKQFAYLKDEKINLVNRFSINGKPISVTTNQLGYIFVLTDRPRKIYILDPREC